MHTRSAFPLDKSAEISPRQKLWIHITDKDTGILFKGVLNREEYAEVKFYN